MSGLAESAQRCNQLCDQHSERYLNTAVGKFPAEVVRASLDKLKKQGFEVRLKTEQETNADLEAFDLAHRVQARPVLRTSYTDQRRRELLEEVNALLIRDRLDWITSQCYARLNMWDQAFVCDQSARVHFTGSQRAEIDRLWRRWKGYC